MINKPPKVINLEIEVGFKLKLKEVNVSNKACDINEEEEFIWLSLYQCKLTDFSFF